MYRQHIKQKSASNVEAAACNWPIAPAPFPCLRIHLKLPVASSQPESILQDGDIRERLILLAPSLPGSCVFLESFKLGMPQPLCPQLSTLVPCAVAIFSSSAPARGASLESVTHVLFVSTTCERSPRQMGARVARGAVGLACSMCSFCGFARTLIASSAWDRMRSRHRRAFGSSLLSSSCISGLCCDVCGDFAQGLDDSLFVGHPDDGKQDERGRS